MKRQYTCYSKIITVEEGLWSYREYITLDQRTVLKFMGKVKAGSSHPEFINEAVSVMAFSALDRIRERSALMEVTLKDLQRLIVLTPAPKTR